MNILKTHNLSVKYHQEYAVNSVNMNINQGDIYGFIGENGAGKTTLIRIITGLVKPTSGSFELFNIQNNDSKIYLARRRISAIVETPSLYLNMSASDNLLIQCEILGITNLDIIDEILEAVGLSYVRNIKKPVKNFSLGMKQRLGIAIALIGRPDFIILDEPMNGLDPEGIVEIRELIIKLNKEKNITFLVTSHNLGELSKIVSKYGFISKGKLIKEITAFDLANECKKCTELTLSNTIAVPKLLESILNIKDYKILHNNMIRIYEDIDISLLVSTLSEADIKILSINKKDESIEEYYLNLIGGRKNA